MIYYCTYRLSAVQFSISVFRKIDSIDDEVIKQKCDELRGLIVRTQNRPPYFSDGERAMFLSEELALEIPKMFGTNSAVLIRETDESTLPDEFLYYWAAADLREDGELYSVAERGGSPRAEIWSYNKVVASVSV